MNPRALATPQAMLARAGSIVPYLTPEEVADLAGACQGRNRHRNRLLILTLFQTGLRISEALSLTPRKIGSHEGYAALHIRGKGSKDRIVSCPENLTHQLKSYAFDRRLGLDDPIFPIGRKMAWVIVKRAAAAAGLQKQVWPHLLRHSDAIERLRQTGNPKKP